MDEEKKTILVVDDEPEVRKLVGAMVSQAGYTAITADSGEHALTLYKNQKTPLELLITDVIQPGMSGPMLADKLTALQPDLKVLYISGYDNTHVVQKYVVEKGHALLPKPFTVDELRKKVDQMLRPAARTGAR
ncbi:MAG TPA: response regulator [Candidatus Sulfopaludibacter sp.]|jgi:CheY-like chemotaxis protein|nr:response regulator [Candidatus Sulfopaludibacter sp.]